MSRLLRSSIALLVALCFLIPAVSGIMGESEEQPIIETNTIEEWRNPNMNSFSSNPDKSPVSGELPQLKAHRERQTRATRADNDVGFDLDATPLFTDLSDATYDLLYIDMQDGYRDYFWGHNGQEITYNPVVENLGNSQLNSVTLRLVVTYADFDEGNEAWTVTGQNELINTTKNIGPIPGNSNTTVEGINTDIGWKPLAGMRVRINLRVEVAGDPDPENDKLYWWPYIYTHYNTVETQAEKDIFTLGAGWSTPTLNAGEDTHADQHTGPTVLESSPTATGDAVFSMDFSNTRDRVMPFFFPLDSGKGGLMGCIFSGAGATSSWEFDLYNTTTSSWEGGDTALSGTQPINDGWYSYQSTDGGNPPQVYLFRMYSILSDNSGNGAKVKVSGQNLYLDDWWYSSIEPGAAEGYVPQVDPPRPMEWGYEIDLHEDEDTQKGFGPGNTTTFNYTIHNIGTTAQDSNYPGYVLGANITDVNIVNLTYHDDMILDIPDPILTDDLGPGEYYNFSIEVEIPEDALASAYFEDNPYKINFDTTADVESKPFPTVPAIVPIAGKNYDNTIDEVEINVGEIVAFAVSSTLDNQTADRGTQLTYTLTVENNGNVNLTEDLTPSKDADVQVSLGDITTQALAQPKALWQTSATLSTQSLDVEYEGSEDVTVSVSIPANAYAGYFVLDVEFEIPDYDLTITKTLTIGVNQVYDIEMDFDTQPPETIKVDPSKEAERTIQVASAPITFEIGNKGNGVDTVTVETLADKTGDDSWITLEEDKETIDIAADDEEKFYVNIVVPEDAEHGYHNFTVRVTSEGWEDDEGEDIVLEETITILVQRPDLMVGTKMDFSDNPPQVGKETQINVVIWNNGSARAGIFPVFFYVDDVLAGYQTVAGLDTNIPKNLDPFTYTFTDDVEYEVKIVVDPTTGATDLAKGNISEIREDNNEFTRTIKVVASDLVIENADWDITWLDIMDDEYTRIGADVGNFLFEGKKDVPYSITISVANTGEADAEDIMVRFEVTDQTTLITYTYWEEISKLAAGKNDTVTFTWTPTDYKNEYFFAFDVDPDDNVTESDDSNNGWDLNADSGYIFKTAKKPSKGGPGFGLLLAIMALAGACMVLYKRR